MPADLADLADVTEYVFHTPPAVGSRLTVRAIAAAPADEPLRAAAQAYAQSVADLLDATDLTVSPVLDRADGGAAVTVSGRLPAEPGRPGSGSLLRAAFVRLPDGRAVHLELVARADDPLADAQFQQLVRTAQPADGTVESALESVAAADGPGQPAGPVRLDLPPAFRRRPTAVKLATPDRTTELEFVPAAAPAGTPGVPGFGPLAVAAGDDGRPVRYELPPAEGELEAAAPTTDAQEQVQVKGKAVTVTGRVAGDAKAAEQLVEAVKARVK